MKFKRPFIGLIAGGLYAGRMHGTCYAMVPGASFIDLTAFAGGLSMNMVHRIISCAIAFRLTQ